uniref:Suppressor APC domain containing 2 n=1 Tax=Sander lucioperca TaxID=283035 RepID=A0A8C9YTL0_SANLU
MSAELVHTAANSWSRDSCAQPFEGRSTPKETEYSTDGLPKAFLHSLRTLFDILDDGGRGYVHISEIESRWQGADTRELPGGVLGCLRRVTPPHGCLTFERFVAGLRYSMLNPEHSAHFKAQAAVHPQQAPKQPQKPAPLSTCSVGTRVENKVRPLGPSNVTNTQQHRASSLQSRARPEEGAGYTACLPRSQSESATGFTSGSRRHGRSREEQRRHTISNGVDYGMLKQMKELEQEKDSLLAGLEVVERARDWYQGQIHNVTERQRQVGQNSHCTVKANQSRMNVLIPKLQEVNRCLNDLISCSGMVSEVTERSERITQLEQEKSALIKQLFEARAHSAQDTSTMDSTFI